MAKPRVKNINDFLRGARIDKGLTQLEAARNLGHSTSQYISNLERGLCEPSVDMALTLCEMYQVSKRDLYDIMIERYERDLKKHIFGKAAKK